MERMTDVTKNLVETYLQPDQTLLIPQSNNWWLKVDLAKPDSFECFTLDDKGIKKIHSAVIHQGPPYPQLVLVENDLNKETKTVGTTGVLVWIGSDGVYIAGRENQRHNGKVWEAWRKSWSSDFKAPAEIERGNTSMLLTDKHLGRILSNSARIVGPDTLGAIALGSQILVSNDKPLLTNEGEWKSAEWFMTCSLDSFGKSTFGVLNYLGYLPKPNEEKLAQYKKELIRLLETEWKK